MALFDFFVSQVEVATFWQEFSIDGGEQREYDKATQGHLFEGCMEDCSVDTYL